MMEEYYNNYYCYLDSENVYEDEPVQVYDVKDIPILLNEANYNNDIVHYDMASLNDLMLGQTRTRNDDTVQNEDEDSYLHRLSLAYERLHVMPKILTEELGSRVKILDISNNNFENLDFLSEFHELTSLICDKNKISSATVIPYLPKLELLWLNHCKIKELYPWAKRLHNSCPNLKFLSLMGNPVAPSYLNGGSFYEYLEYRWFIISIFPNLVHLDDQLVTDKQRKEAKKMYHRPLIDRIVSKTSREQLPTYLRIMTEKLSDFFTPLPSFIQPQRNAII